MSRLFNCRTGQSSFLKKWHDLYPFSHKSVSLCVVTVSAWMESQVLLTCYSVWYECSNKIKHWCNCFIGLEVLTSGTKWIQHFPLFFSSNNPDAAVEYLEPLFISGELQTETGHKSISFVYKKLVEKKSETALEKCKFTWQLNLQQSLIKTIINLCAHNLLVSCGLQGWKKRKRSRF